METVNCEAKGQLYSTVSLSTMEKNGPIALLGILFLSVLSQSQFYLPSVLTSGFLIVLYGLVVFYWLRRETYTLVSQRWVVVVIVSFVVLLSIHLVLSPTIFVTLLLLPAYAGLFLVGNFIVIPRLCTWLRFCQIVSRFGVAIAVLGGIILVTGGIDLGLFSLTPWRPDRFIMS